ncbi:AzlD domain-containing protein [Roseicyclus sp. F158]|uniref:AzlD domain-containing protein n=1 Tax=Tropicimonas omnivorans TaxID=3075590 RepID=A0ABU3DC86_9RHOB|nr:AzlD domain-containing protein [Roseicyclus sp. F158]MDT0681320.1 AzlD domain-containing protein [Roseicyclus sp. F158]
MSGLQGTMPADAPVWTVILVVGFGTWLLRFSFTGLIGDRPLPGWILRHLRYTAVAVIPALIAPLVFFPAAGGGAPEPARLIAAIAATVVGIALRSVLGSILAGFAVLYAMLWLLG